MPCYSPLKGFIDEVTGGLTFRREGTKAKMEVACGQCIGCRLDRARMWSARMVHESSMHELDGGNCFITLTYRDKAVCTRDELKGGFHIPDDWSLDKKHFQDFIKRLRKARRFDKIKYYHCGEYGNRCLHGFDLESIGCPLCNLGRPHYHACLFNCSFEDLCPYAVQQGVERFTSGELASLWKFGYVDVGDLTVKSAGYVARYIMKKVTGDLSSDHYTRIDEDGVITFLAPEYSTMSNGIGSEWWKRFSGDVFPSDEIPVVGKGVIKKVPRYYDELLRKVDEDMYDHVKAARKQFKLAHADEYTPERLMDKYRVKKAQVKFLARTL